MSKYNQLLKQNPKNFKRLVGVNPTTLGVMIKVFKDYEQQRTQNHGVGGRKTLPAEDKVLLMLAYYREYRTLAHIGVDYGVSEATASRTVKTVEKALISSGKFSLPSKRALHANSEQIEYLLIDATECPIQRPKKTTTKSNSTRVRKSNTR